jgi:hypothetical protein
VCGFLRRDRRGEPSGTLWNRRGEPTGGTQVECWEPTGGTDGGTPRPNMAQRWPRPNSAWPLFVWPNMAQRRYVRSREPYNPQPWSTLARGCRALGLPLLLTLEEGCLSSVMDPFEWAALGEPVLDGVVIIATVKVGDRGAVERTGETRPQSMARVVAPPALSAQLGGTLHPHRRLTRRGNLRPFQRRAAEAALALHPDIAQAAAAAAAAAAAPSAAAVAAAQPDAQAAGAEELCSGRTPKAEAVPGWVAVPGAGLVCLFLYINKLPASFAWQLCALQCIRQLCDFRCNVRRRGCKRVLWRLLARPLCRSRRAVGGLGKGSFAAAR